MGREGLTLTGPGLKYIRTTMYVPRLAIYLLPSKNQLPLAVSSASLTLGTRNAILSPRTIKPEHQAPPHGTGTSETAPSVKIWAQIRPAAASWRGDGAISGIPTGTGGTDAAAQAKTTAAAASHPNARCTSRPDRSSCGSSRRPPWRSRRGSSRASRRCTPGCGRWPRDDGDGYANPRLLQSSECPGSPF